MKVILLENVKNLGMFGSIVSVAKGFARNYLIPFGKAVPAVPENISEFEKEREQLEAKAAAALDAANARAEAIKELGLVQLSVRASEEGKLYGSVSNADIAQAYTDKGCELVRQEVKLEAGLIREVGTFKINIILHSSVIIDTEIEILRVEES